MSRSNNLSEKFNRAKRFAKKTARAKKQYWASDDVHRIAMRRPNLYETKLVPKVDIRYLFTGGQYD